MVAKRFTNSSFEQALSIVRGSGGGATAANFYTGPTPAELHAIYANGYRGIRPESTTFEQKRAFKDMMGAMPRLYEIFPWAKGLGAGKINLSYLAALHFSPTIGGDEAQTRGSCTVHSTSNAAEPDHANDALFGETQYKGRLVKENIYRSRGYNSDGWSCQEPAYYIGPDGKGGLLYRKLYTSPDGRESVDFTKFSSSTENWAGNGKAGVPTWLQDESKKNKAGWIIPISSMEEYRDAIALQFGISICSGQGFSSNTDQYGLAEASGSWSHAMAHWACIDTEWARKQYGDMIGGDQQSWGPWNRQNGKPPGVGVVPVGMFFARAKTLASMLRGGDSFAVCSVRGWDRTGFEAFNVTDMVDHLQSSFAQDYYKTRAERASEYVKKVAEETPNFLAI